MRKPSWRICLSLTVTVFGSTVLFAESPLTADDLIAKYIKASGGREKMDAVKSRRMTGKTVFGHGGMESPTTVETKRPNKVRIEFTFQGMTGTQAFDGKTGWSIMPFGGKTDAEKMSEDALKQIEDEADLDGPLVDYKQKGHTLELMGKEDIEGASTYKLKLTKKNTDIEYYFLDAETFLPIKVTSKRKFQGTEMEMEQIMSDYKSVEGLMLPHSYQNQSAGGGMGSMNIIVEKVEINPSIADDRFTMPEVKKADAPIEKKEEPGKQP